MTAVDETREAWLGRAAEILSSLLVEVGEEVPPLRISVGFPGGSSNRKRTIGQCWPTSSAEDGVAQIFISPIRGEAETVPVLGTLLHEMIHAVDDCQHGHKKEFVRIARAVGFEPKWTSSDNRSEALQTHLEAVAEDLGPFPHAALFQGGRAADTPPKQSSRQLKITCPEDGYIARTTQKWLDELGVPTCPCGTEMVRA